MKSVQSKAKCSIGGSKPALKASQTGLLAVLKAMPPGSLVPVAFVVSELIASCSVAGPSATPTQNPPTDPPPSLPQSWKERLWECPAETRLGVRELAEACGRPRSWVYKNTQEKAEHRLPHRKLEGSLVFLVGECRCWIREQEEIICVGETDGESRLRVSR